MKDKGRTVDAVSRFGLSLLQPESGYRFSLDALLLADFASLPPGSAAIIDLGTGCGVIALILARTCAGARVVGLEQNPAMAELAMENARLNNLDDRVRIVCGDVLAHRQDWPVSGFDLVLANPPFRAPGSGRISPRSGRDAARHETTAGMADFLAAAKYLVKPGGRICFIHHPSRLPEFIQSANVLKLALLRLRMVHGTATAAAKMFLVELAKGRRGELSVEPPLIVYDAAGGYTDEVTAILGGGNEKASAGL